MEQNQIDDKVKEYLNTQYYMASHPKIRSCFRGKKRPTEFGNKIWQMTFLFLQYLEEQYSGKKLSRVVEIGCGWGIVAVHCAKHYQAKVLATDIDEKVLPIVAANAELNQVDMDIEALGFADLTDKHLANLDLLVGVEICYSEQVAQDLIELATRAKKNKVKRLLIADPGRPDFDDLCRVGVEKLGAKVLEYQKQQQKVLIFELTRN